VAGRAAVRRLFAVSNLLPLLGVFCLGCDTCGCIRVPSSVSCVLLELKQKSDLTAIYECMRSPVGGSICLALVRQGGTFELPPSSCAE
jgi:hypothetical protein